MKRENRYQSELIKRLYSIFPDCIILKNDEQYIQGFPDLLILKGKTWAALETKRYDKAKRRPNQPYYVELLKSMSYASFISPENEEEVIREIHKTFGSKRSSRISKSK